MATAAVKIAQQLFSQRQSLLRYLDFSTIDYLLYGLFVPSVDHSYYGLFVS